MSTDATVHVLEEQIGTISPRIYGHFAEHLGRCCYDGLWVGKDCDKVEHINGFRKDVVEALKRMRVPLLRWPGGCYADHYHWRDGIGPDRKTRLGTSCSNIVEEDNSLGTHEFLDLCAQIGAEPYLAGNMGSGTVQELCDWIEYCNHPGHTALANERRGNGREWAWNVLLWGVGNESWGCGGSYEPEQYALEYRRYVTMMQHIDPGIEPVAVGFDADWNKRFLKTMGRHLGLVSHLSIHQYWLKGGPGATFSEEQYYELLTEAEGVEAFIVETSEIIKQFTDSGHKIGIALDEWGVWHPEARTWGSDAVKERHPGYEQPGTMRDAIAAAIALEAFHRQCNVLSMANLAQIVNVLHAPVMTAETGVWVTPTYHVLAMHAPHAGATALKTRVDSHVKMASSGRQAISATASRKADEMSVTVVNRHFNAAHNVLIDAKPTGQIEARLLAAPAANSWNSLEAPDLVSPRPLAVEVDTQGLIIELPPHSVATVNFKV